MSAESLRDFPEDVARLRLFFPDGWTDERIADAWEEYSEDPWCAGWMTLPREDAVLEEWVKAALLC